MFFGVGYGCFCCQSIGGCSSSLGTVPACLFSSTLPGTAATVTFVLVDFVYLVRELILELVSEVVLAAPPQYSANEIIRKQHQKTSLDRGELRRFFSGTI